MERGLVEAGRGGTKAPMGYHHLELSMRGKADIKVKVDQSAGLKAPTTHKAPLLYRIFVD